MLGIKCQQPCSAVLPGLALVGIKALPLTALPSTFPSPHNSSRIPITRFTAKHLLGGQQGREGFP